MSRRRPVARLLAILLLAFGFHAAAGQEPAAGALGDGRDELRARFLELLNEQRQKQGLAPLRLVTSLARAAQAQVDDMVARQYYALTSPEGRTLEDWIKDAGYREQLVTEKIFHTDRMPQTLAASWSQSPDAHRQSLFNPEVEELGVGIGDYQGLPLYVFVLARSEASYLSQYTQQLFARQTARFEDLDGLRQEMLRLVNEARAARKLDPLTLDSALNRAAQGHAEEVFQALKQGRPVPGESALAQRVKAAGYRMRRGVGESVVQGTLSPEETLAALLGRSGRGTPNILGSWYTQLGLGLSFERTANGFFVVWVQCLSRPASSTERAHAAEETADPRVDWLRHNAVAVRSLDPAVEDGSDLQPLKQILAGARIVMLGEQSHKDGATFTAKVRLVEFLHREMGFDVLAFESGLYDCAKAWERLQSGEAPLTAARRGVFAIWSRSAQVAPLFEYMGRQARSGSPLELAGFDNQVTGTASSEFLLGDLMRFLGSTDVETREDWPRFQAGLRILTSFEETKPPDSEVQRAFTRTLDALAAEIRKRPASREAAFWLQVIESERSNAKMSWELAGDDKAAKNLRDEQMARNLLWLARERYPGKKIVVWTATYHAVRNPASLLPLTDLPPTFYRGVKTMGDEVAKALGNEVYVLGFTAHDGEIGNPASPTRLAPAREGSLEDLLNQAGAPFAILNLRKTAAGGEWLRGKLVARPLGYTDMQADWTRVLDGMMFIRTMTPREQAAP